MCGNGEACECAAGSSSCTPCDLESSTINEGIRLCRPALPIALYQVFDVEVPNVINSFAIHPGLVYPGFTGVDEDGMDAGLGCSVTPGAPSTPWWAWLGLSSLAFGAWRRRRA